MMTKDIEIRRLFSSPDEYAGQDVVIRGWVRQNRSSNKFGFLAVNDGSFFSPVQVVYEADTLENYKDIAALNLSSAVMVRGEFVLTPENKHQAFEIHAREIVVEGPSAPDYPLQKKGHSMEFLREIAHLRPRSNTFAAVFRVRSLLAYAIHRFFQERGFIYVHTPIITGSDAEGAGEMFRVTTINPADPPRTEDGAVDYTQDFFGRPTNLTVSGQLEGEIFAHAFRNIYTFGPTFRAEDSNTTRHASEFWMIEPEMAFCDLDGNMQVAEDMIRYILSDILETAPEELEFFNKYVDKGLLDRLAHVASSNFERVSYTKAIELLEKADRKFENPVSWGIDLATEHERYLTEEVFKRPIFVTDYPADIKAFYMRRNPDGKTVAACDMLVPGIGEIIGGSQREERLDVLEKRMDELGMDKTPYWWYLELRKYGGVVHSGYGLGFERMVMYATGMGNIRDVIPFPRTPKSAEF